MASASPTGPMPAAVNAASAARCVVAGIRLKLMIQMHTKETPNTTLGSGRRFSAVAMASAASTWNARPRARIRSAGSFLE